MKAKQEQLQETIGANLISVSRRLSRSFTFLLSFPVLFSASAGNAQVAVVDQSATEFSTISASYFSASPVSSYISPYDYRLMEPLNDLAREKQEEGDHLAALSALKEAWQVNRVNNGLYNASQIPLLEGMIRCEEALRDWGAVNDHYSHMEHLYRRLYDIDDPRLDAGLRKVSSWHVTAININLNGNRINHLREARRIFKLRLQVAELTLAANHPKFEYLLNSIAFSERQLYLASDAQREKSRRKYRTYQDRILAGID